MLPSREVVGLDEALHWFCPRSSHDDQQAAYFDEDLRGQAIRESEDEKKERGQKITAARKRRDNVLRCFQILAYNGDDARPYQDKLKRSLDLQLTRCDVCVREYHRSRPALRALLEEDFDADEVANFMTIFDAMNTTRIVTGLNSMAELLTALPPAERKINAVGDVAMYAMFEALHCVPFLRSEDLLLKSFDKPFRLAQSNKKFTLGNYAPGMVAFLYSTDPTRLAWAERNFNKVKFKMCANEFEYSVRPFLEPAMNRVNVISLELDFLPIFWRGTRLLISKITKPLLTNNLRGMDGNLLTLSLEHFQVDADHFSPLISTYVALLELSASDFWEAMGSVSPQNVVENICKAPKLEQMLTTKPAERVSAPTKEIEEAMAWVEGFVQSIAPGNLVPPVRTLLDQLLRRFQEDRYTHFASGITWKKGLASLLETVMRLDQSVNGGPVYVHLIEAVAKDHIAPILKELDGIETMSEVQISSTQHLDLEVIKSVIALDVKSLARDRQYIEDTGELDHELGTASMNLWKLSMRHIKPGHPHLVIALLNGMRGLLPVEKFAPSQLKHFPKHCESWNNALGRTLQHVTTDFLHRLDEFTPDQLDEIYQEDDGAKGLVSLLFSGNDDVHQAALNVLKTMTSEDSRQDSLKHLLEVFFTNTLAAVTEAMRTISVAKVFTPCSVMLKLVRDVFNCLCDSQDGILRSRVITDEKEAAALRMFWVMTWSALETIFSRTEKWSDGKYEKSVLSDFCRDTMDFANTAFDQYSLIATTIVKAAPSSTGKKLLEMPSIAFRGISMWLRLRDEYLIAKAVALTSKMLIKLQENAITLPLESTRYIENNITNGSSRVKTRLTPNHKAELQQALEKHIGRSLSAVAIEVSEPIRKKQGTLQTWAQSAPGQAGVVTTPATGKPGKNVIDIDAWTKKAEVKKPAVPQKPNAATQKAAQKVQQDQHAFLLNRQKAKAEADRLKQAAIAKANGNLGAGSGVAGLGNFGKDHAVKGQNIMVSSDEESEEDEEDDMDDDLFGGKVKQLRKADRPGLGLSGATGLRPEAKKGPTRIHKTVRSLKDMRARLAPDLGSLHRTILGWNFFFDGDFPPGSNQNEFSHVSNVYTDPTTYQQTFEPLLLLEAWQGLVKSREENSSKPYEIKVHNRSNVDHLIEISSVVSQQEQRELSLMEGDIILLSKASKPADHSESPNCLARVYRIKRQKGHIEVVYQFAPSSSLSNQLTMQALVYGLKVQSITPLEREYGALKALQYYDLCNQIVRAKPSPSITHGERQIQAFQDSYNVNRAQSEAINAALHNEGFSLIQGPPGSGKTKTIVAIVGGLLTTILSSQYKGATRISMPKPNGNTNGIGDAPSKKLLVCAPSNAAVDELVMRLKNGIKTRTGESHKINVVRIGKSERINAQVADVTMEELVQKKLGGSQGDEKQRQGKQDLFKEHEIVSATLRDLYSRRDSGVNEAGEKLAESERATLESSISQTRRRKAELGTRIDNVKDQERNAGREQELNRKRAQQAVLDDAHVICATLSGSGHDMFQSLNIEFETVIIDEAAQCVEMSSLIPLKYGCVKCIMVGDPKQLPPTVFSKEAARFQYEQSLFVRMQNNYPNEVHLLDTQYRMHPDISVFPSRTFYDGLLKDGTGMAALRKQPWHASALLAPYRFFDVKGQHQAAPKGHSLINMAEIDVAMALFDRLTADYKDYDFSGRIGIITPYKSQLRELKNRFINRYGADIGDAIDFNTTDAFQGREAEIIIFSCVRASPAGGIGFLQDIRRMNVGLTRAKSSLWVLGNSDSLSRGQYWRKLVEDAQGRDCYITGNVMNMLKKPSSAFPALKGSALRSMEDPPSKPKDLPAPPASKPDNVALPTPPVRASEPDRMDGITYAFKDRVAQPKQEQAKQEQVPSAGAGNGFPRANAEHIKAPSTKPPEQKISEDIEMADAGAHDDTNAAPTAPNGAGIRSASGSRAETPLSGGDDRAGRSDASSSVSASRPAGATVPAKKLLKRPAKASPFLPKKAKPGPR